MQTTLARRLLPGFAILAALTACADPGSASPDVVDDADAGEVSSAREYPRDDVLRLNHVQVKGTHNSYHIEPDEPLHPSHEYTLAPLDVQLGEQGVRQFELDLHLDPDGVLRVYHIRVIDPETTCETFIDCLQTIRSWSDANPWHSPIFIWIEPKDEIDPNKLWESYDDIDAEIRSVFPDRLITPDMVQGDHPTLRDAVVSGDWPTLGEVRGHVVFIMLDSDDHQRRYTYERTTLAGRAMFVKADSLDAPYAAFTKYNNPITDADKTRAAVAQGFIVACNAGSADGTDEDNEARVQAGLDVGAHTIGTDYPAPVDDRYWFEMPSGTVARCNPISAPEDCEATDIE